MANQGRLALGATARSLRRFRFTGKSVEAAMLKLANLMILTLLLPGVAACGNNPGDRALTGGAIGAAGGAVVGAAAGNPIAGAVVGGLGGAAIGAATTPRPDYSD
jgi:hypothetical protein